MSKADTAPTMIIPNGTEIQIDSHGQLSIRTPGNLVIQSSGHYGEIESTGGSIRIEANAEVEAVSLRCADTCYVQGSLTAWKVTARALRLEDKAQARIVLQETQSIEVGKSSHLFGNFASEKELFLLFSRFASQLRSLPFYFDRKENRPLEPPETVAGAAGRVRHPIPTDNESLPSQLLEAGRELPDGLFFALVLLERETKNDSYGTSSARVLEELVKLLKNRDLETLQHTHRTLFSRIVEPGAGVSRAAELIASHFQTRSTNGSTSV